jgi:hypothetical protein
MDVEFVRYENGNQSEGFEFAFDGGAVTELQPGERVVVVEDAAAFKARYGSADIKIAGEWDGALSNGSETVTLLVQGTALQQFAYDDEWYPETDGQGSSLEIFDARAALDAWRSKAGWRASIVPNGTPGKAPVIPGDSNGDGLFNSTDLIIVTTAGEYEDSVDDNSTFNEGDWDGDGDFTTRDMVLAFQYGAYIEAGVAAVASDRSAASRLLAGLATLDDHLIAESPGEDLDAEPSKSSSPQDRRQAKSLDWIGRADSFFQQFAEERSNQSAATDDGEDPVRHSLI